MITLHHLENSRSQRILWLLEELEIPYRIERYERDPKTQLAPESLKAVHPLGRSPVITDGDITVAESGAIIEYLVDTHGQGRFVPEPGSEDHRLCRYWMHYAEGSLMPLLLLKLVLSRFSKAPVPLVLRPAGGLLAYGFDAKFTRPRLAQQFAFIERHLDDREWLAGAEPSIADVQMSFPLEAALARDLIGDEHAGIRDYVRRYQARPAYQRALEAGGPYEFAGD